MNSVQKQLLARHNSIIYHGNQDFRIIAQKLGSVVLAQAEPIHGGQLVDLIKSRSAVALGLRRHMGVGIEKD